MSNSEKQSSFASRLQPAQREGFGGQQESLFFTQTKPAQPQSFFSAASQSGAMQMKCEACASEELQRQTEEEEPLQMQQEEEEPLQGKLETVQRQAEEEEPLQMQQEEEEPLQGKLETLQRQAEEEEPLQMQQEEEEPLQGKLEPLQRKPIFESENAVQTKLSVSTPGDPWEREADRVAEQVVNAPATGAAPVQRSAQPLAATISTLTRSSGSGHAKMGRKEGQEDTGKSLPGLSERFEQRLSNRSGSGKPLPPETKQEMEQRFGADFSNVRIHNDGEAAAMSASISAQAFTHGRDVYFNAGRFDPDSRQGQQLLAHELTHVVQQQAAVARKPDIQREEADPEDLKKQIEESNREQRDALDPSEARESRQEAVQEALTAEQQAGAEVPEVVAAPAPPLPDAAGSGGARIAVPVPGKPDRVTPRSSKQQEESPREEESPAPEGGQEAGPQPAAAAGAADAPEPGPTGQLLEAESAGVCNQAAADAQQLADNEQAHDTAEQKAEQTDVAVEPPEAEGQSRSNSEQVEVLEDAEAPAPNDDTIKRERDAAIDEAIPRKIKELNEFESKKKAQVIGNAALASTNQQVGAVQGTFNQIEQAPEPAPAETPVPLPEIEQAPETPTLNLGEGAVPDVPQEHTDLSQYQQEADAIYEEEGIQPEMRPEIDKVDSGDIGEANKEKTTLNQKVADEPAQLQEFAQTAQQKVENDLQAEENQARDSMEKKRGDGLNSAKDEQGKAKDEMKKQRDDVTKWINDRYKQAQDFVMPKLAALEESALKAFDDGQKTASIQFEQNVKSRVNAWKSDRYSGFWGPAKWLKDKVVGIDHFPEIKNIFTTERATFVSAIDLLIVEINRQNELTIKACKDELAAAKTAIAKFIEDLDPALKDTGLKAQKENEKKLADLDAHIEQEKKKLQQKLCDKKDEAIKAIDKKIEEMKAEMSGIVGKLKSLLLGLAKKFFRWAIEKIGGNADRIIDLLSKGAVVLKKLFTDPIGFFGNLIKAVGGGIGRFIDNIQDWLKKGLLSWLLGAMADSGLQLPDKLDLKGMLFIGLQVAGLTWNIIRAKVVKALGTNGEAIMAGAEKTVAVVQRVIKEGPMALWHIIAEKAAEIKESVLEGVRNWAVVQIVKKATAKILMMLNPVGAIIQAIMLIYDVVMFFIDNWDRIVDFVKSVFDSIGSIAAGAVGQAAAFIEKTLGKTIPLMLSFFARFVGLDGIGKTIRNIIKTIQKPFEAILNKVVKFLAGMLNKALAAGGKVAGKIKQGATTLKDKVFEWWKQRKMFKDASGNAHTLFFDGSGSNAVLSVASKKKTFIKFINSITIDTTNPKHVKALDDAKGIAREIDKLVKQKKSTARDAQGTKDQSTRMSQLLEDLGKAISIFTIGNSTTLPASSNPVFGGLYNGFGKSMTIKTLTRIGPPGKSPRVDNEAWQTLKSRKENPGGRSYYVRGHLLNEYLHGSGTDWQNFAIITQTTNQQHLLKVEDTIYQQIIKNDYIAEYSVSVNYANRTGSKVAALQAQVNKIVNSGGSPRKLNKILKVMQKEHLVASSLTYSYTIYDLNKKKIAADSDRIPNKINLDESAYHF